MASAAFTRTYSAQPPWTIAATRSPPLYPATSGPTETTSPAASRPGIGKGAGGE